ncbi:lytic polysaccharide monooxygenase [Pleomassaria siparia CBS 279.74]|uniref:Lytic polysaccharide monooxygenase n=1 Tax=Pleomassaria siparia CBS 279.74 TaxID=1314801 RepID=A0A6G1K5J5_9PLEO|nr:lytic polysaccharide monooxygenase [Pleomassaria siparia CBS 279.74]
MSAMSKMTNSLALVAALIATASAHTAVKEFTANGVSYEGYYQGSKVDPNNNSPAWWTNQGWGYQPIMGSAINTDDFIAHMDASPSPNTAPVAAGSDVTFEWYHEGECNGDDGEQGWDCSHHGWTATYLAPCNGDCANVDKTELKFFKIHDSALIDYPAGTRYAEGEAPNAYSGRWGTDNIFYENQNKQNVTIPSNIPSGNYVLRTEVMSIHNQGLDNAQLWPQAFNVKVQGGDDSAQVPDGVAATSLYDGSDPILNFNLYWHTPAETFSTNGGPDIPAAIASALNIKRSHKRHARVHSRAFTS